MGLSVAIYDGNTCREERYSDCEGNSIEKQRRKAIHSVLRRHSELGGEPEQATFRFAPMSELRCVRVNVDVEEPRNEIHSPGHMAEMMNDHIPLQNIAKIAWFESDRSHEEICAILNPCSRLVYGGLLLSEEFPINHARASDFSSVTVFEWGIEDQLKGRPHE